MPYLAVNPFWLGVTKRVYEHKMMGWGDKAKTTKAIPFHWTFKFSLAAVHASALWMILNRYIGLVIRAIPIPVKVNGFSKIKTEADYKPHIETDVEEPVIGRVRHLHKSLLQMGE